MTKRQKVIRPVTEFLAPLREYAFLVEDYVKGRSMKIEVLNSTMIVQDRPDEGFEVVQSVVLVAADSQKIQFSVIQVYHEANPAIGVEAIDMEEVGKKIIELRTDFDPKLIADRAVNVHHHRYRGCFEQKDLETEFKFQVWVEMFLTSINV